MLFLLINVAFAVGFSLSLPTLVAGLYKDGSASSLFLIGCFFILNLGFSLVATTNILRYQYAPMFILLGSILSIDFNRRPEIVGVAERAKRLTAKPIQA
jgi:hypothetical protein